MITTNFVLEITSKVDKVGQKYIFTHKQFINPNMMEQMSCDCNHNNIVVVLIMFLL